MNRLAQSTSPYLLQHADNPVDWHPWGEEALQKAKSRDKPIFLSIGYAACHWCHVMAHESFSDAATAAIMNENFICIKVDREERPDLDGIYMSATTAMTGSGGWPMSVFLSPDLRPFFAGTYFPPVPRYNLPAFKDLLNGLAHAWHEERDEIDRVGAQVVGLLTNTATTRAAAAAGPGGAELNATAEALLNSYDWAYGGWGGAPKFPQPMAIEFLLRRGVAHAERGADYHRAAVHALHAMARGGMYDVVGGGFSRYSTDAEWRVPHFEKMLYDNAQLAQVYLHAWQITHDTSLRRVVEETLNYVIREMTDPGGGFYSSLDADSEGEEGKYYAWTEDEIRAALASPSDYDFFAAAYGITSRGNWEGRTILQREIDDATLAARFELDPLEVAARLSACHASLSSARATRVRPATDNKVLAAWNGLMLEAFSKAARVLQNDSYLSVATRNATFVLESMRLGGSLHRSWRAGRITAQVFLEDYAALVLGLLELYQTDFNTAWFAAARELSDEMIERFQDPAGGFHDTPAGQSELLFRPKDLQDNATPSGNALACEALIRMAAFTGRGDYRDLAEAALKLATAGAMHYPLAHARWLSAAHLAVEPMKQVAILYAESNDLPQNLLEAVRSEFRPNLVVAASPSPPQPGSPDVLIGRPLIDGRPTAYVCEQFLCRQPVTTPDELRKQL